MRKLAALIFAFGFGLGFVWMSARADERFDHKVRNDFFAGVAGDKAAFERAMKATEVILTENPQHAEALVWHGSGLFSQSGEAFRKGDREKGMELWAKGTGEMDQAVALQPGQVGVLAVRGAVYTQTTVDLPPERGRPLLEKGIADFEKILEVQKDRFARLGEHPRGEVLFGLGHSWYRAGDEAKARSYFERVVKELPGTEYEKRAKTWLETRTLAKDQMRCYGCHVPSSAERR